MKDLKLSSAMAAAAAAAAAAAMPHKPTKGFNNHMNSLGLANSHLMSPLMMMPNPLLQMLALKNDIAAKVISLPLFFYSSHFFSQMDHLSSDI